MYGRTDTPPYGYPYPYELVARRKARGRAFKGSCDRKGADRSYGCTGAKSTARVLYPYVTVRLETCLRRVTRTTSTSSLQCHGVAGGEILALFV